jgi:hypothetical protein
MADRFPLIVDSTTQTIKELPSGDNLDLTGSSIVNASSIDVTGTVTADGVTSDGNISMSGAGTGARFLLLGSETNTYAGSLIIQAGGGSAAYGGGLIAYGHSHASKAGDIVAGISSGSGGSFRVNTSGIDTGGDVFVVEAGGNVGIGTDSPNAPLTVQAATSSSAINLIGRLSDGYSSLAFRNNANDTSLAAIYADDSSDSMQIFVAGSEAMRIDADGNVGIGCTPEDWDPAFDVLRVGKTASLFSYDTAGDGLWLGSNAFYDDTLNDYKYITTDPASLYTQLNGTHSWSYAASGTADTQVTFSEAMRIDASGNVDIGSNATASAGASKQLLSLVNPSGTTSTAARLWMSGTNATTRGAYIEAEVQSTGNDHDLIFATSASGAAPSEAMRIDSSGNVGIGGPNPLEKLFVAGNVFAFGAGSGDGTYGANIQIGKNNGPKISSTQESSDDDVQGLAFFTKSSSVSGDASVERMRIDSSGNVGIGDNNPLSILHIGGGSDANVPVTFAPSTGGNAEFRNTSSTGTFTFTNNNGSSEAMRIDADGDVGIGTNSPSSVLSVKSDINNNSNNGILFEAADSTNKLLQLYENSVGECYMGFYQADVQTALIRTNGSSYFNGGNVGIGISIPSEKLNLAQSVSSTYTAGLSTLAAPAGTNIRIENNSAVTDTFTGVLFVPTNGAAQPQISYVGSVSTGSGLGADIVFGRRESSAYYVESMRIDASGNVGIGESSIGSNALEIRRSGASGIVLKETGVAQFYVEQDTDAKIRVTNSKNLIFSGGTNGTTERMRIDSSGNVGIGRTSDTAYLLDIQKSTDAYIRISSATTQENAGIILANQNNTKWTIEKDGPAHELFIRSATDTAMTISQAGNVGIGATPNANWRNDIADQAVLQLNTEATFFSDDITTELWNNAYIDNTDIIYNISTRGAGRYQQYQGAHKWWTAASATAGSNINTELGTTPKMTLDVSGNLLVGTTTTPSLAGLAVGSTSTGKNISVFSSSNGSNGIIAVHQSNGTQEGQLYAGTGDINLFGTSAVKVVASSGGVQLTSGATSWTAISDERVKDIIEPITNAAQKVSSLRAVIGKYKTDTEETRRSFLIAQDVQAVLPEAVDATNEDNLGVRYTETIPLLVAAIQEQQATIEALTARIEALES